MKNIISILFIMTIVLGHSQTKTDTVDFKNVSYKLLNQLIFEKCNQEREKVGSDYILQNDVCSNSAEYQSNYMSNFNEITHHNNNIFRGITLYKPIDRFNYFNQKFKSTHIYKGEICFSASLDLGSKYTYDQLSQKVIDGYMFSQGHKTIMLSQPLRCSKQYGDFSSSSNIENGVFNLYVAGVLGYDF